MAKNQTSLKELLRQKRELLDLSLAEVEAKTGIRVKNLKALESGTYYDLPAPVYVQGYLKTLARLYSLEFSKIMELYNEERNLISTQIDAVKLQPQALHAARPAINSKSVLSLAAILGVLIIVGYMGGQIRHVTAAPELRLEQPLDGLQITQNFIEIKGATEPGAELSINNQNVPVASDGSFQQTLFLDLGENQIVVRAANRFNKYSEVKRRVVVADMPQVLGEQTSGLEEENQ